MEARDQMTLGIDVVDTRWINMMIRIRTIGEIEAPPMLGSTHRRQHRLGDPVQNSATAERNWLRIRLIENVSQVARSDH
jgi:hypothetical protein